MVPHGPSVRVAKRAQRLRPQPISYLDAPPINRTIVASLLRAAAKLTETEATDVR